MTKGIKSMGNGSDDPGIGQQSSTGQDPGTPGERPPGAIPIKEPMTEEQCENYIMLKGQTGERWFEVRILDPEIQGDPTMAALMESVSEMIFKGIQGMPFTEAEHARSKGADNPLSIVDPSGQPLGDDAA